MKIFILVFFLPIFAFGTLKDEILEEFSAHLIAFNIDEAQNSLDEWERSFFEDKDYIDSCRAFLFLLEGKLVQARSLFEASYFNLRMENHPIANLDKIFYHCLEFFEEDSPPIQLISDRNARIVLCKRGWKIKSVFGAVMIGVGGCVACVAPVAGFAMISAGASFVFDGALDSMDESDHLKELEAQKRREEEFNNISYIFPNQRDNRILTF